MTKHNSTGIHYSPSFEIITPCGIDHTENILITGLPSLVTCPECRATI